MKESFFRIQTSCSVIAQDNADDPIDLNGMKGVIDFSIKNGDAVGGSDIEVIINGISITTLAPGDPMLMLGGYHNAYRIDRIALKFTGGTGRAECYINKRVTEADCLL